MTNNITKENFNKKCPFGMQSTKHFSTAAKAPKIKEAREANILIRGIVDSFANNLEQRVKSKTVKTLTTLDFNSLAKVSSSIHSHSPTSFDDIFPININKNAETIIDNLNSCSNPIIQELLLNHESFHSSGLSHKRSAFSNVQKVKKLYDVIIGRKNVSKDFMNVAKLQYPDTVSFFSSQKHNDATIVSDTLKAKLIDYQNIQERFENSSDIHSLNTFMLNNPRIFSIILAVQKILVEAIADQIKEDPNMKKYINAFSEIGLLSEENKCNFVPSSRFLKIITHNWGMYFTSYSDLSDKEMIAKSIEKALEEKIYLQNIFLFKKNEEMNHLEGIAPIMCPASDAIGKMFLTCMKYLPDDTNEIKSTKMEYRK